jgi:hypothetical protein
MSDEISLRKWLENYENGIYNAKDVHTQIDAGWWDWFCTDASLARRLRLIAPKVKKIAKSAKINPDKVFIFFKNNCPMRGHVYDDFRICDLTTGDVIWTIVPRSECESIFGKAEVWGKENDFEKAIVLGSLKEVYSFFGV